MLRRACIGFFLEVDLNYADGVHDFHDDYPLEGKKKSNRRNVVSISIANHRR